MKRPIASALGLLAMWPMTATAGEEVLRGPPPAWVSQADLGALDLEDGPAELIADNQHRIEDGVVYSYHDSAVRIDNGQSLMAQNTVSIDWLPDKGDLTVHRLEILRDGETVPVLGDGTDFDVIRREQGLEARLLDGALTATLSIPGLRVGDVLRTTYSVSVDDQALGDETQVLQYLGSEPWRVGFGRAIVSWPEDEPIRWKAEDKAELEQPVTHDGYRYLTVDLPLAKPKDMPRDAPYRYQRPAVLRVGSFADWKELSAVMAPHFYDAAEVDEGGAVARRAAAIMKQTSDRLERAALATRMVQDEVSYLLNGLEGGNYLPQAAEFTWDKRYGDCKAKSTLLLALLQRMGIEAEPVLVSSVGGDAVPELLPVPGDFDHVIVRAVIGGTDYWLDGTSSGTRLTNIADVPPFYHGLPLRAGGADLVALPQRAKAQPDMWLKGTVDLSAGVDFPQLFDLSIEISGAPSAQIEMLADADNPQLLRRMASSFAGRRGFEGGMITALELSYDKDRAIGHIELKGVGPSSFEWRDGKLVAKVDPASQEPAFNPDRARPDWRDIPVATPGPSLMRFDVSTILPEGGEGFSLKGPQQIEGSFANTRVETSTALVGGRVAVRTEAWQGLGEVAPEEVAAAKRDALRLQAAETELVPPSEITWRWDLDEKERKRRAAPIIAAYDKAIAFAEDDDFTPLTNKAAFLQSIFEFEKALAAYDELIEKSPSAWSLQQRSQVKLALGQRDSAIADLREAYDLDLANTTAFWLAKELAYAGQTAEAIELLDALPVRDQERVGYADARAIVSGLEGDTDSGLALLSEELAQEPENSDFLNADCWFRGLFNVDLDSAVRVCTRAIERADNPMAALDSRALVQFRLGDYDAAIADLNSVLKIAPSVAESRYMRGVVRLKQGDAGGREDIETALRMSPRLAETYGRHGLSPAM